MNGYTLKGLEISFFSYAEKMLSLNRNAVGSFWSIAEPLRLAVCATQVMCKLTCILTFTYFVVPSSSLLVNMILYKTLWLKLTGFKRWCKLALKLLDNRSKLTIDNSIIKPSWTCGSVMLRSTKPSNSSKIQSLRSIILSKIIDAPSRVATTYIIHNDPNVCFK